MIIATEVWHLGYHVRTSLWLLRLFIFQENPLAIRVNRVTWYLTWPDWVRSDWQLIEWWLMSEIESDASSSHDTMIKYKDCNTFCAINVSFKLFVFHFTSLFRLYCFGSYKCQLIERENLTTASLWIVWSD